MCDLHHHLGHASGNDEYVLDTPAVRKFIHDVKHVIHDAPDRESLVEMLKPAFSRLLGDRTWLPDDPFCAPCADSGMGGGIGQYLIYKAGDGSLCLFSLVVPAGSKTPVHDHLAWGLIGLYQGEQADVVYERLDGGEVEGRAVLRKVREQTIRAGDFYTLLPPDGDIHHVETISREQSVSLHLLGNDTGCVWRHKYIPEEEKVVAFRSGYVNSLCLENE